MMMSYNCDFYNSSLDNIVFRNLVNNGWRAALQLRYYYAILDVYYAILDVGWIKVALIYFHACKLTDVIFSMQRLDFD